LNKVTPLKTGVFVMDIDVRDVGPDPLIAALGRELGIDESIN
jgi:hypothetical protein